MNKEQELKHILKCLEMANIAFFFPDTMSPDTVVMHPVFRGQLLKCMKRDQEISLKEWRN